MLETIPGLPASILLNWLAALLYILTALLAFGTFLMERSELNRGLLVFLTSMAFALGFIGVAEYTKTPLLMGAMVVAVFAGGSFLLRLPCSLIPQPARRMVYATILAITGVLAAGVILVPTLQPFLPRVTTWYLMIVNGVINGLYLFTIGLRSKLASVRIKAAGGGVGIIFASLAAPVAAAAGATAATSTAFHFLAPLIIIFTLIAGQYIGYRPPQGAARSLTPTA
ncbi:MAG: hypothetical protein PHI63_01175 [Patescibacteria group bacterium]|nr:hypothetical protein [Patescibacteria group bacterium]